MGALAEEHDARVADPLEQRVDGGALDVVDGLGSLAHERDEARVPARRGRGDADRRSDVALCAFRRERRALRERHLRRARARGGPVRPALPADERHEADVRERHLTVERARLARLVREAHQDLRRRVRSDGNDESPSDGELREQRRRGLGPARGHDDGIERCLLRPADGAVAVGDDDVREAEPGQPPARRICEGGDALNRIDLAHDAAQDGRGIARARPHLEDAVPRLEAERLERERDDVGLRDCLTFADGERRVVVRELGELAGDELFARHSAEGREEPRVGDSSPSQVNLQHPGARALELRHRRPQSPFQSPFDGSAKRRAQLREPLHRVRDRDAGRLGELVRAALDVEQVRLEVIPLRLGVHPREVELHAHLVAKRAQQLEALVDSVLQLGGCLAHGRRLPLVVAAGDTGATAVPRMFAGDWPWSARFDAARTSRRRRRAPATPRDSRVRARSARPLHPLGVNRAQVSSRPIHLGPSAGGTQEPIRARSAAGSASTRSRPSWSSGMNPSATM